MSWTIAGLGRRCWAVLDGGPETCGAIPPRSIALGEFLDQPVRTARNGQAFIAGRFLRSKRFDLSKHVKPGGADARLLLLAYGRVADFGQRLRAVRFLSGRFQLWGPFKLLHDRTPTEGCQIIDREPPTRRQHVACGAHQTQGSSDAPTFGLKHMRLQIQHGR